MAIQFVIDDNAPDGNVITISELDNHIRFHKRDVKERMDDSILDTGVASWTTTTSKQMKEGLARVHVSTAAAKPTSTSHGVTIAGIKSNQLWIRAVTDTPVTAEPSFQYYDGAAWQHVRIGQNNILDGAVTLTALPAVLKPEVIAEVTDNGLRTSASVTWVDVETTNLSLSITPDATTSIVFVYAVFAGGLLTANANVFGGFRLRKTSGVASTIQASMVGSTSAAGIQGVSPITLCGVLTGEASYTVKLQYVTMAGATDVRVDGSRTLDTQALLSRMGAIELKA